MRVLFITRKYPPMVGGMEALSYHLTRGFPEPKTIVALCRSQKHLFWFFPYACLRAALTAYRYDLIHLGDPLLAGVALIPRLVWRRKVAVTVHGLDLTYPVRIYQWYLRHLLRADTYIAISESTRRIAAARGLAPVPIVSVGAPDDLFELQRDPSADPELFAVRGERVVLITVGRLVPRKGVAWFVRNVLPSLDGVLYVVVGEGPDRAELERTATEFGVGSRLLMLGAVSRPRLLQLLQASDIFVMPNIPTPPDVEGFGIVAIEAAASGLPVVASRLEGIPDAVCDGENGLLVAPGDADAFLQALRPLVAEREARLRLGERARAFTRHRNGWSQIVRAYQRVFEQIGQ